jgi:hypothetical protein
MIDVFDFNLKTNLKHLFNEFLFQVAIMSVNVNNVRIISSIFKKLSHILGKVKSREIHCLKNLKNRKMPKIWSKRFYLKTTSLL